MDKFIGFIFGVLIVDTLFSIIKIIWYLFLNIGLLFWEAFKQFFSLLKIICKKFFNLLKIICKKLYSSFKNRKTKS